MYFRVRAHQASCGTVQDSLQQELLSSVQQYAGFVDANVLCCVWPQEMARMRVCLVSGAAGGGCPMFTVFTPPAAAAAAAEGQSDVQDIVIHSDGSHFTLMRPRQQSSIFSQQRVYIYTCDRTVCRLLSLSASLLL